MLTTDDYLLMDHFDDEEEQIDDVAQQSLTIEGTLQEPEDGDPEEDNDEEESEPIGTSTDYVEDLLIVIGEL